MSKKTTLSKLDWLGVSMRTISIGELAKLAKELASEDGENTEYERALAELVTDAAGLPMDFKKEVARRIGLKGNVE